MEDKILKRFSRHKKLKFNDLKQETESNKLSYHLKKLIKENLLEKNEDFYTLTDKGEEKLCYLEDKGKLKQPIHDVFLLPFRNGKFVVQKRTKRPLLDIIIPIGARIRKGDSIFETAKKTTKRHRHDRRPPLQRHHRHKNIQTRKTLPPPHPQRLLNQQP